MIYERPPRGFSQRFRFVGCFILADNRILLLRRKSNKPQGGTWSIPGGKAHAEESAMSAILREIREETGLELSCEPAANCPRLYVRVSEYDFSFDVFQACVREPLTVAINNDEHSDYSWVTIREAHAMNLIEDLGACLLRLYPSTRHSKLRRMRKAS